MNQFWTIYIFIAFVVSFVATMAIMPALLHLCRRRGIYDVPNERKVHRNNIPRLGGVLFVPCMLIGGAAILVLLIATGREGLVNSLTLFTILMFIGMFLIYLIGLLDDLFGMKAIVKFVIQIVVSSFMPFCGLYIHSLYGLCGIYELPLWAGYGLTVFISLLIVNAINLIDGIDGLASTLCIYALAGFAALFFCREMFVYSTYCMALTGSVLAFWLFNMFGSPERGTKTFMGDTGSLTLGYALAFVAIRYLMTGGTGQETCAEARPLLVPFSLLIVPCFDLVRVALMRLARGKSIFHPDKTHIHHKCLRAGFSMHMSLIVILLLQIFFGAANWAISSFGGGVNSVVAFDVLFFVAFNLWLNRLIVKNNNPHL